MKIGVLGSGSVGQALGAKFVELGHDVILGSRTPEDLTSKKGYTGSLSEWLETTHHKGKLATLELAAKHGELIINALPASATIATLESLKASLSGKILLDVSNELDMSKGFPPISLANDLHSIAENVQATLPDVQVVKSLNTVGPQLMVNPKTLANGNHTVFVGGNREDAKAVVKQLLSSFGWTDIVDLGDIRSSRAAEMLLPLVVRSAMALGLQPGMPMNFSVVR
ncbi:MAG: NADPH-dependent F420 reductase [Trueperaceae bacterium]